MKSMKESLLVKATRTLSCSLLFSSLGMLALATPAEAHLNKGTYRGLFEDGSECSFTVENQAHDNGYRHPLNEVVTVRFGEARFSLQHRLILTQDAADPISIEFDCSRVKLLWPTKKPTAFV